MISCSTWGGVTHVQAVAGASVVHVVPGAFGHQAVIGGIVYALEAEHWPQVIALCGVVIYHVQNDFDPRLVQGLDHLLELLHLLSKLAAAGVLVVGRQVANGTVAPVVAQATLEQQGVVHKLVDRQKLHCRHTQAGKVLYGDRMGQAGIGASQLGWYARVADSEAFDVDFVDDGLVPGRPGMAVVAPVEVRVDDYRPGYEGGAVAVVGRAIGVMEPVGEHGLVPPDLALDGPGVRVQQQLGRVAAVAFVRLPGTIHAEPVALAGADVGQVPMPAEGGYLRQLKARLMAVIIEQAQLHLLC